MHLNWALYVCLPWIHSSPSQSLVGLSFGQGVLNLLYKSMPRAIKAVASNTTK